MFYLKLFTGCLCISVTFLNIPAQDILTVACGGYNFDVSTHLPESLAFKCIIG